MIRPTRPARRFDRRTAMLSLAAGMLGAPHALAATGAQSLTVFAAASLKTALDALAPQVRHATGHTITVAPAGSAMLARQIAFGAPADIFISANTGWMDRLQADGQILPGTRVDLLSNSLVLIAPAGSAAPLQTLTTQSLQARLSGGKLAMAQVDAVPAGIYGKAALAHSGLWDGLAGSVAQTDNVRAALALVASGAAPLGIVYGSDVLAEPRVRIVAAFAPESHPPVVYPAAVVTHSAAPDAAAQVLTYLCSAQARGVFQRHGFVDLGR